MKSPSLLHVSQHSRPRYLEDIVLVEKNRLGSQPLLGDFTFQYIVKRAGSLFYSRCFGVTRNDKDVGVLRGVPGRGVKWVEQMAGGCPGKDTAKKKTKKFTEAGILSKTMQYSVVSKYNMTLYQVHIPFPPLNGYVREPPPCPRTHTCTNSTVL